MTGKNNRGEITIEATIVLVTTMFVLFAILSFGFLIYEKHNVSVTASTIAVKIAQTYAFPDNSDLETGLYTVDPAGNMHLYRYLFGNDDALQSKNEERAQSYGITRLSNLSLASPAGEPTLTFELKNDGLGRNHVEVTINAKYEFIGSSFLSLFGLPTTMDYQATGYAECLDIIDYVGTVNYANTMFDAGWSGSSIVKAVKSWWSAISKLIG